MPFDRMLDLAQSLIDDRETNTRKALKQAKKFRKDVWTDDSDCSEEDDRATDTAYGAMYMVVSACCAHATPTTTSSPAPRQKTTICRWTPSRPAISAPAPRPEPPTSSGSTRLTSPYE